MHDIKWIRENPGAFDAGLKRRGLEPESARLLELDEKRRIAIMKAEQMQARRNAASKEIGAAKKNKDEAAAQALMAEVTALKERSRRWRRRRRNSRKTWMTCSPRSRTCRPPKCRTARTSTTTSSTITSGRSATIRSQPKQHFELGEDLRQMDFETAAKLSGARFVVLKSGLARMERALGQFFIDVHTSEHGYTEIAPPLLVRDEVMFGTGATAEISRMINLSVRRVDSELSSKASRRSTEAFDRS